MTRKIELQDTIGDKLIARQFGTNPNVVLTTHVEHTDFSVVLTPAQQLALSEFFAAPTETADGQPS